ncbi:MAG TPA: Uma2 family endonuclease [Pyrinomonadaceae bacterium]|nr:Uma2 family endonuclease [Pyrinomonadaceae bacterium]
MSEKAAPQTEKNYTSEEYLKIERNSSTKHEFIGGKVLSLAGSNRTRSLIGSNTTIAVGNRIHGQKNEIYSGNMRVQMSPTRFSYPDVVIVSSKPAFIDNESDVLLNPTIVVEIYSKNTSSLDKTEKLECYLAMDSIREYLLVKEDEMRVEHYAKQNAKQWVYRIYNEREEIISMESINCKVSLTEIYAQINFDNAGK